ncbi:probable non-specific lipid-transfer protein 2 [Phragmites australis]|uniref:probable non-specific lipid-transfer protein 2 n=1 Tax=Phragmites australis TaxID=29695 RepID=UPI002D77808D|nr:probable non-specific lipid-transfer protein 2 [Phragmites australis]
MAASKASLVLFLVVLTVSSAVLSLSPGTGAATTCTPTQLTLCAPAIVGNAAPAACCARLKAHSASCFCRYKKDPNLQRYVNSPNDKKVFVVCKVPVGDIGIRGPRVSKSGQ